MKKEYSTLENDLWKLSKHYRFLKASNKQKIAFFLYLKWNQLGSNVKCIDTHPMLWEIATIVTLMIYPNNQYNIMSLDKFQRKLPQITNQLKEIEVMYTIKQFDVHSLDALHGLSTNQNESVIRHINILFRYHYFFNHEFFSKSFNEYFKVTPYQALTLGYTHAVLLESLGSVNIDEKLIDQYIDIMNIIASNTDYSNFIDKFLTIDQTRHNDNMSKYSSIEEFVRSPKYIYTFPFIRMDYERILMAPHNVFEACTKSLMRQFLEGQQGMLKMMGKVLESYILEIADNGNYEPGRTLVNDNITYNKGKNKHLKGEDLVLYEDGIVILISSKHHLVKHKYRLHDQSSWDTIEDRYTHAVVQSYKYYFDFGSHYRPFDDELMKECQNVFSLIILDSNVSLNLERIVESAKDEISKKHDEYVISEFEHYLINNLRFIKLDILEFLLLNSYKLTPYISDNPYTKYKTYEIRLDFNPIPNRSSKINKLLNLYSVDLLLSTFKDGLALKDTGIH